MILNVGLHAMPLSITSVARKPTNFLGCRIANEIVSTNHTKHRQKMLKVPSRVDQVEQRLEVIIWRLCVVASQREEIKLMEQV